MQLTASEHQGTLVVHVGDDRIDAAVAVRFKDTMKELTRQSGGDVILNLADVVFIDSSGLGAVVGSMKQLGRGRRMDLAGLQPSVEKVFRMTRMDSVFRLFEDIDDAVQDTPHAS